MFSKTGFFLITLAVVLLGGAIFLAQGTEATLSISRVGQLFSSTAPAEVDEPGETLAPFTILFGGDMMFDRYIRTSIKRSGEETILGGLAATFQDADLVVANLEGPITENASVSETSLIGAHDNYVFTFDPLVAPLLKRLHIDVVNIGNNHIMNFGKDGVVSTKQFLSEAGVGFFGSPLEHDERILMREIRGTKVAFVNYNQFVWHGKEKALEDIATAKKTGEVVILYTHWGTEYVSVTESVRELSHQFIEAGADLIIGSHPHIVQEKEVYRGKVIYYSLGNLVFDQYFSEETKAGLLVRATLDPKTKQFSFEDIPVILKSSGQTVLRVDH